jgi:hypothetical protein
MPWVRFEPTVPALERAKTVHALDRSDTVTGPVTANRLQEINLETVVENIWKQ